MKRLAGPLLFTILAIELAVCVGVTMEIERGWSITAMVTGQPAPPPLRYHP